MSAGEDDQRLRVAINCQFLPGSGFGGWESLLVGLLDALGRLDDEATQYVVIGPPRNTEWMKPFLGANTRIVRGGSLRGLGDLSPRSLGRWFVERVRRFAGGRAPVSDGFYESLACDVIHFPYQYYVVCAVPTVYNPHDLQYLHYPQFFTAAQIAWRQLMDATACRFASSVVVTSRWGKDDVVRHYGVDPDKIQILPGAPPVQAHPQPDEAGLAAARSKYGLQAPYALYPAMTWPHKNHLRLVEALALLRDRDGVRVPLICTGHQNDFWPQIEARIAALGLRDQVRFLGLVPAADLRAIYRLAQFVVIPTLFEATSGPLLEAWLEGTPAACSTVTALPEQAGDAALLFDPLSVEAIASAVARMATDGALRQDLARRGANRLRLFRWQTTAKAYRAVYRRAAGRALSEEDRILLGRDWTQEAGSDRESGNDG
jgi:glycosyltransferase involved in cell wall biosynthesis